MIIETICERGIVRLPKELKFQHNTFKVKVEVPDQEISLSSDVAADIQSNTSPQSQEKQGIRAQIDAILGSYKSQLQKGSAFTAQDYKDMWHQHLEEKYLERR